MWKKAGIGILAGIISGFFTSGGGLILVPAFMYLLKMTDVKARATSVLCIMPMVLVSGIIYFRNDLVQREQNNCHAVVNIPKMDCEKT